METENRSMKSGFITKIDWRERMNARRRERKTKKPVRAFVPSRFQPYITTFDR